MRLISHTAILFYTHYTQIEYKLSQLFRHQSARATTTWLDAQSAFRAIAGSVPAGVTSKDLPSGRYWYRQESRLDGVRAQVYIGPDSDPAVRQEVARLRAVKLAHRHASSLAKAARVLGCVAITPQHGKVIEAIAGAGFFQAGGLIGGTHAFLAYQNHLGVIWGAGETTMDLDFIVARGSTLLSQQGGAASVQLAKAIEQMDMGFVERTGQGGFVKADEPDFEIDLLTNITRSAPAGSDPVAVKGFDGRYLPLKFMELAFNAPIDLWVMSGDRLIKVRAPDPCDFALHKLIVSFERKDKQPTKSAKDLIQAGCLFAAISEQSPAALESAYLDVIGRGKGWQQRVDNSLDRMVAALPELETCVQNLRDCVDADVAPSPPRSR